MSMSGVLFVNFLLHLLLQELILLLDVDRAIHSFVHITISAIQDDLWVKAVLEDIGGGCAS